MKRWEGFSSIKKLLAFSLVMNWIVGPLLEVPVLIIRVNVALSFRRRHFSR